MITGTGSSFTRHSMREVVHGDSPGLDTLIVMIQQQIAILASDRFYGNLPNSVIDPNRSVSRWPYIAN
jgi:hypothetical protein